MKTPDTAEVKSNFRIRARQSESVSMSMPVDVLEDIRRVAANRDMSDAALIQLYVGQGLRQDLSRLHSERVREKTASVLARHIQSQEEVAAILHEIQAEAVR